MIEVLIATPGLVGLLLPLTLKEALWIVDVAIENAGASINVFVCGISASKIWWKFSGQTYLERRKMIPMESRFHWRALLTKTCTLADMCIYLREQKRIPMYALNTNPLPSSVGPRKDYLLLLLPTIKCSHKNISKCHNTYHERRF